MKRDAALALERPPSSTAWRVAPALAAAVAALGILAVYAETAASIVAIWIRSETYAHGFAVIPICLWLVWRRRDELAAVPARPWWPGLGIVAMMGALWLVTSVADVLGVKQFALAFMVIAGIVTVVGLAVARANAFALAFLLFAVPAGEFLVPIFIDWTADFTVWALRMSGVPIYREVNQFIIPSGAWSVVEACSGVRYLIASVMVGTIYAAVAYRTPRRRVLFVIASVVVPIVANWLRAYMIVMIGHLSNNTLAIGVDHIIYGWIFFGVVMLALFMVGSIWREDSPAALSGAPAVPAPVGRTAMPGVASRAFYIAAAAVIVVAGVWPLVAAALHRPAATSTAALAPIVPEQGWTLAPAAIMEWKPRYRGFTSELQQTFRAGDRDVGLYVAYYQDQQKGRELVTSGNQLIASGDWNWKQLTQGNASVVWAGQPVTADYAELSGPSDRLEVLRLYWIDGHITGSAYAAKAWLAWSRLFGHSDDSALVVLYARKATAGEAGREALRAFTQAMSPAIERALERPRSVTP